MSAVHKKIRAAIVLFVFVTGVALAATPPGGPAEAKVAGYITAAAATVVGEIAAATSSLMALLQYQYQLLTSAVRVNVSQSAKSGDKVSNGIKSAFNSLSSAETALHSERLVADAFLRFNAVTGQGHDVCATLARTQTVAMGFDAVPQKAKETISLLDVAPAVMAASPVDAANARMQEHRNLYCTLEEAKAGWCQAGALPGADTNAALLFEPASPGTLQHKARRALIQHVLGPVDPRLSKDAAFTAEGLTYFATKQRKDAFLSVAAYSLGTIDAMNTRNAQTGNRSPNELLASRVNQYLGGPEAERWAQAMAMQTPRGVMVELVKMHGLETWLAAQQVHQNQRLELNLAALLLANGRNRQGALIQDQMDTGLRNTLK